MHARMKESKKHIHITREMLIAAYYFARCSVPGRRTRPPKALGVRSWRDAYDLFYDALGDSRSLSQFRNSIKSVRASFDSGFDNDREGWKKELAERYEEIRREWGSHSDDELEACVLSLLGGADRLDDVHPPKARTEGGKKVFTSIRRERDPEIRKDALDLHGYDCMACGFNFEERYGLLGKEFIEVHHVVPLAKAEKEVETDPETDLVVLCSNCHKMVHHPKDVCLSVHGLKEHLKR